MKLTTSDLVVLAVLSYERPMHGYELVKILEERDVKDWALISRAQVYYSIRKLAAGKFLEPVHDGAAALGPDRIVYKPTAKARRAMKKKLADASWATQRPPSPFATWTALALLATPQTISEQLSRRDKFLQDEIAREKESLTSFKGIDTRDVKLARVMVMTVIKQFEVERASLVSLRAVLLSE